MGIETKGQALAFNQGIERLASNNNIKIGNWYLIDTSDESLFHRSHGKHQDNEISPSETCALVCANRFESNLVVLNSNECEYRVLSKNMDKVLKSVDQAQAYEMVNTSLASKKENIDLLQQEMQAVIQNVNPKRRASESTEVAVVTENSLIQKGHELKNIHGKKVAQISKGIESNIAAISAISKYITLPAMVNLHHINEGKSIIDEKVHDLAIYGGLYEKEVEISKGYSARDEQPIHIYQDLKYMDAECLDSYVNGGINNDTIHLFDKWLAKPENRDRVMPHPKSVVAIKNRLHPRRSSGWAVYPNDTYLYLRNGENIKRIKSLIDIGDTLLATDNAMGAETFVKVYGSSTSPMFEFMTADEHEFKTDTIRKLKPIYIQSILDQHRLDRRFLNGVKRYLEGRENAVAVIHNDSSDSTPIKLVQTEHHSYPKLLEKLDADIANKMQLIAKFEQLLDSEINSNEGYDHSDLMGFRRHSDDTVFGLYVMMSSVGIEQKEIAYVDSSKARHAMPMTVKEHADLDSKIVDRYKEAVKSINQKKSSGDYHPFRDELELKEFSLVNDESYFFDDIKKVSWSNYKRQNELAVLIQGIIDRTSFFGYTEASLFKSGYEEYIKLIYDKQRGLYDGEEADFKQYITDLNDASEVGDVFYGQAELWNEKESDNWYQYKERFGYYGYDKIKMPVYLKAEKIINKRDGRRVVLFKWQTERDSWSNAKSTHKNNNFECDIKHLINVSKYQKGDYQLFANDPRCRAKYQIWGEKIMMAEAYYQNLLQKEGLQ